MAQLFLHKMPLSQGGFKYTIICTNDIADSISTFLQDNFEMEVMATGTRRVLRSETRFELNLEIPERIQMMDETFREEENVQGIVGMDKEEKAEYHKKLLAAFSLN